MIERKRFAMNRICCPALSLEDFFRLTADTGLSKVELRNDLPGAQVIDGMSPAQAAALANTLGVTIVTINALQKFNLPERRSPAMAELEKLLQLAREIRCPALVLCPNNDPSDRRDAATRTDDTIAALRAFGPLFKQSGVLGYVEPLGFEESSLSSVIEAVKIIQETGFGCFKVVYDTFHFHLGPHSIHDVGSRYHVVDTGLIHVSGVDSDIPKAEYRDEHRVLPGRRDKTACREQLERHLQNGYAGIVSMEPFAPEVQRLSLRELSRALNASIDYLQGADD